MPTVSVIVPSYRRHKEVQASVRSVLSQTRAVDEIVVVNDGPDPVKRRIFEATEFAEVRYIEAPARRSAAATRNYGIAAARGDYVALLDDDDYWLPEKMAAQMLALEGHEAEDVIVGCQSRILRGGKTYLIRPARAPRSVSASELLYVYGGIDTSALLAPRRLFLRVPFNEEIERHEDWEWMLHAGQQARILLVPEVYSERILVSGAGLSGPGGYHFTRTWYLRNKPLLEEKARLAFLSSILSRKAGHERSLSSLRWLMMEALMTHAALRDTLRAAIVMMARFVASAAFAPESRAALKHSLRRGLSR